MSIPFIDLSRESASLQTEIRKAIRGVLRSHQFILKDEGKSLENEIAKKVGTRYAVGVASGSDALYLALLALGIGEGDEVITTPFTFFATAGAIARTGARPVFADIDSETLNLDAGFLKQKVTKRTKAVIPVHLFGNPCDMRAIAKVADRSGIAVVEDAAQSFGARYRGKETGAIGDAGCFSFFPTKNLGGAGDGGMVASNSKKITEKIRFLRVHGAKSRYYHEFAGINSRLDEIQAAILRVKLKRLDAWNETRREYAREYCRGLEGLPLRLPAITVGAVSNYHIFSVLTSQRDELAAFLSKRGISTGIYYPIALHLQPCFRSLGYRKGDLPISEKASREILSLPMFPGLKENEKRQVIKAVSDFFKK